MHEKAMYLERAVREHGSYAAAIKRIAARLRALSFRLQCGTPDFLKKIGRDLGIAIKHLNKTPYCPVCNLCSGLNPIELSFLEEFYRFGSSKNAHALAALSIEVCLNDASDAEIVIDPLARFVGDLVRKMKLEVNRRVAKSLHTHGKSSFMYN
jgi:hypothetical protein